MTSSLGGGWRFWWWHIDHDHIEQLLRRVKCHVWLFSFDPNHWISFNWSFFLLDPVGRIGFIPHLVRATFKECKCVCQGCPQVGSRRATRKYRQAETELQPPLHRALSCRVGTKTRKYRQSDTGVDGPGTYNHSGRFLRSFRGEQNTFIYMFTEICVLYAYEVCSMYEYKKRKRLRVEAFNKILPKNYIIKNTMGKKGGRG